MDFLEGYKKENKTQHQALLLQFQTQVRWNPEMSYNWPRTTQQAIYGAELTYVDES